MNEDMQAEYSNQRLPLFHHILSYTYVLNVITFIRVNKYFEEILIGELKVELRSILLQIIFKMCFGGGGHQYCLALKAAAGVNGFILMD